MNKTTVKLTHTLARVVLYLCSVLTLLVIAPAVCIAADIDAAIKLPGPRVAANPQDKWVLVAEGYILVITADGEVFAHRVEGNIADAYQLPGNKVAANPQDKWVLVVGGPRIQDKRIIVITSDGGVFGHDFVTEQGPGEFGARLKAVADPYRLDAPKVADKPQDKWVVADGNRILVITNDGGVFAHDITGHNVGSAYKLAAPPVAANPPDKWVQVFNHKLLVITNDGRVFNHELQPKNVAEAKLLSGPKVAANPPDKWVLTGLGGILVITRDGGVFKHALFSPPPPR